MKKDITHFIVNILLLVVIYNSWYFVQNISVFFHKTSFVEEGVPPSDANQIIQRAAEDFIKDLKVSVRREKRGDMIEAYGEAENSSVTDSDDWTKERYPLRVSEVYDEIESCDTDVRGRVDSVTKRSCFLREYIFDKKVPLSYDVYTLDETDYRAESYSNIFINCIVCEKVLTFDYIEGFRDPFYNSEMLWMKARGADEVWKRVQEKFRWN